MKEKVTLNMREQKRLADWEKQRLNQLFSRYPEVKNAWVLKESFRAWYGQTDRKRAEQSLEAQGIKLIAESTNEACTIYNQLCHSQRVVAALHLTC